MLPNSTVINSANDPQLTFAMRPKIGRASVQLKSNDNAESSHEADEAQPAIQSEPMLLKQAAAKEQNNTQEKDFSVTLPVYDLPQTTLPEEDVVSHPHLGIKFTVFLIALFIAVNVGLVMLLKSNHTKPEPQDIVSIPASEPLRSVTIPSAPPALNTTQRPAVPSAPMASSAQAVEQEKADNQQQLLSILNNDH